MDDGRDSTPPINRLPPELLTRIFLLLNQEASSEQSIKKDPLPACFLLSHVCQSWRDLALACSELWADTGYFFAPALGTLMLSRSRNAPLTVRFAAMFSTPEDLVPCQMALAQVDRVREIEIVDVIPFGRPIISVLWPSDFRGNFPILESLDITRRERRSPKPPFHARAFGGSGFHAFLRELDLWGFLPLDDGPHTPTFLQALRDLSLHDTADTISTFLRAIQIPDSANVNVRIDEPVETALTIGQLLSDVKFALRNPETKSPPEFSPLQLRRLVFSVEPQSIYCNTASLKIEGWIEMGNIKDQLITLAFPYSQTMDSTETASKVGEHLDLSVLQDVSLLNWYETLSGNEWISLFKNLETLKTIAIAHPSAYRGLLDVLCEKTAGLTLGDSSTTKPSSHSKPYFPSLSTLKLKNANFERGGQMSAEMVANLQDRSKSCPLAELRLERCKNIERVHFETIRRAKIPGLEVSWDEVENLDVDWDTDTDTDTDAEFDSESDWEDE
ncbi:hypothetical protein DFP72DRAFT_839841 [Ephemerocybe angulata]|uniref:F-box domain-containing protein n=1 Tax=Ephemerocybe angulata TaxID=980116 RepID=A0A8H6II90_9AGAR|nr:hypothetical protein DFP72DRAFT_839841 [Tulosesus angulatus]